MLLEDKVVLVTGGGRNVGAGIVRSLAREGATVAINCYQSLDRANALADSLREQGAVVSVWQCDVRDTDAVETMMEAIITEHGRLDGVVNNASHGGHHTGWDPHNWNGFTDCFDAEVKMVLNTIWMARSYMREQGGGRVVNIITEQVNEAFSGYPPHITAKSAVVGISRKLVAEMGQDNITGMDGTPYTRASRRPIVVGRK